MLTPITKQGYVNHVHVSGLDASNNVYLVITYQVSTDGPTEAEIVQRSPGGSLNVIFTFDEPTYGKAAYGGITPLANGDLFYAGSHRINGVQSACYGVLHQGPDGWELL